MWSQHWSEQKEAEHRIENVKSGFSVNWSVSWSNKECIQRSQTTYRVTRYFYITVITSPGMKFGITLHSLYRNYFSIEIVCFTLHYLDRNPQVAPLFVFTALRLKTSGSKFILRYITLWLHKNIFQSLECNNFRSTGKIETIKTKVERNTEKIKRNKSEKNKNETPQVTQQGWMIKLLMRKELKKQTNRSQNPPKHITTRHGKTQINSFPLYFGGALHWKSRLIINSNIFPGRFEFMIYLCVSSRQWLVFPTSQTDTGKPRQTEK